MKKHYFLTLFIAIAVGFLSGAQSSYSGNGNSGFGGPVGQSSLQLTDDGTTVTGTFTRGTNDNFNNELVIYIDSKTGGFTSTANFNDPSSGDKLRRSIAGFGGFDGASRSVVNFPAGFEADYAIAINTSFGGLWTLVENAEFPFVVGVGNPSSNTDASFTFSFKWEDLGIPNSNSFDFLITYMDGFGGNGVFRSNEGYGNGLPANNPGTDDVTFTSNLNFTGASRTIADGNWSSTATWTNGIIPISSEKIIIKNNVTGDVDITVDNSITVESNGSLSIAGEQVLNLNGALNNNGTVIFDSDAAGTAQLVATSSAAVTGNITVERFIPAADNNRRAFRFVSSPVASQGSIYQNWQDNGNSDAGIGTQITGSTDGSNGFDATISGAPSLFTFDNTASNQSEAWNAVDNTDVRGLAVGEPFRIFVRGDRNYDLSDTDAPAPNSNVTLPVTGTPELDAFTADNLNETAGNFSLVGNPYQAVVDYELLTKSNVNPNFIYVWNANASTRGAYETVDVSGVVNPLQFIQPGQSFFVTTAADGAASLGFDYGDVSTNNTNLTTFSDDQTTSIIMKLTSGNSDVITYDELSIVFDDTNVLNLRDGLKIFNPDENLSRSIDGQLVSVEHRALPENNEVLDLDLRGYDNDSYVFSIDVSNLPGGMVAILNDRFANTRTILENGENTVSFEVTDTNADAADRFSLEFESSTASNDDVELAANLSIYPNPASTDIVTIKANSLSGIESLVTVSNTLGQTIVANAVSFDNSGIATLDVSSLSTGIYLVTVNSDQATASLRLLVK
ncbi:T9SS type A sorting domain-containing protein [Nonlabens ponticola]|uniref:T9SS type A sorting domain-containing protein n=1 Tax=Nonlabens ponticola TaxID=2496866 RepID=A0A3S9MXX9_9FLAO|nr:T9SS type A sorting domain-containing protein [Nonlabens ponticola]AZQ44115.1 T9SS type A sorting domain-containing protein [Nonlabens ponticola]